MRRIKGTPMVLRATPAIGIKKRHLRLIEKNAEGVDTKMMIHRHLVGLEGGVLRISRWKCFVEAIGCDEMGGCMWRWM